MALQRLARGGQSLGVVAEGAHGQHPPGRARRRHRCPGHQRGWVWLPGPVRGVTGALVTAAALRGREGAGAAAGAAGGGARKALGRRSIVAAKAKPPNVCKRTSCAAALKYPSAAASARQAHPKCTAVSGGSPAAAWRKAALAAWTPAAGCWAMLEWSWSNVTGAAFAKWWQATAHQGARGSAVQASAAGLVAQTVPRPSRRNGEMRASVDKRGSNCAGQGARQ